MDKLPPAFCVVCGKPIDFDTATENGPFPLNLEKNGERVGSVRSLGFMTMHTVCIECEK